MAADPPPKLKSRSGHIRRGMGPSITHLSRQINEAILPKYTADSDITPPEYINNAELQISKLTKSTANVIKYLQEWEDLLAGLSSSNEEEYAQEKIVFDNFTKQESSDIYLVLQEG
ncbi:unnamed protein product [Bursaphelenchus okinawaensis]|uniref:Uncharacterized protein n=1 Tax=Bursaphelenchus okinawaensis TaxID=465554 RepID=A0A811KAN7_9BILA|nr:unnamed protein product [Bursaphelenchus okinawaensis]CAG9097727.1 unnamed protein product [Bursaphelenchus okinawaensis]